MKFIRLLILPAVLLGMTVAARADLASLFTNAPAAVAPHTSIIFIQCHGLGCGDLSCYGQTNFQTPVLDQFAAAGMRFTNYRAGADLSATLTALMTGKHSVAPGEANLAQRLQQAGYHTGLIGEWTLGAQPWLQGFDEFAGFLDADAGRNYYADYLWRYAPRSIYNPTNHTMSTFVGREMIYPNTGGKKGEYMPDLLLKAAGNFVRVHQPDQFNRFRPFFLLVNLPAPRTATAGKDDFPVPTDAPFTDEPWPQAAKNRAALLTRLDTDIGVLLEQVKKSGLTNNLAIFFAGATAPEKFANTNLVNIFHAESNPAAPLPMLARWPGMIPAGRVSDLAWTPAEFAPTVLRIASVREAGKFGGNSILRTLLGETQTNLPAKQP